MRIGIHTWGPEGDTRPFAALAHALAARGHAVTLACACVDGRDWGDLAAAGGFIARPIGAAYFAAHRGLALKQIKGNPLARCGIDRSPALRRVATGAYCPAPVRIRSPGDGEPLGP
jgi:hypothetical protein